MKSLISLSNSFFYSMSRWSSGLVERAKMTENTFMIGMAIIIGALAGYAAVFIRFLIETVTALSFGEGGSVLDRVMAAPWYMKLAVPAVGGLIVGPLIHFFAREAKGHGVPEVMEANILRGGVIRPRVALVKMIASAVTIGTGGSVGREGPIIQIGSTIGSTMGQFLRVSSRRMRTFVAAGAAAGIAAAFNAPMAGALFAAEIILLEFDMHQFSPIVVSSVMATVISHHFSEETVAFQVPGYTLTDPRELFFYGILAVITAFVGWFFIKMLYFSEYAWDEKLPITPWLKPALGGLIVGGMGIVLPQVMGVGYDTIDSALNSQTLILIAVILVFAKMVATSMTLGSGGSGGVFAPSLYLGALTGVAFGGVVNLFFPDIANEPGAYALVAMGGLLSASTHAPLTAIIMVFELTSDYNIILPLMITCILSTIISKKLSRESIYTLKLIRQNIQIKDGAEINVMKSLFVKDIYTTTFDTIRSDSSFDEMVQRVISGRDPYFPVVNGNNEITGIISMHDLKEYLYQRDMLQNLLIADDVANHHVETVTVNDNCQTVLDKTDRNKWEGLPVVDPKNPRMILGMIWRKDILDAYNKEIARRDLASSFASRITRRNIDQTVHFMEGYSMMEIPVPDMFVGKSIRELDIRAVYGVDIILIRSNSGQGSKIKAIPSPEYVFTYNDSIIVAGEEGRITMLKSRGSH